MGSGRVEVMTCIGLPVALDRNRGAGFVEFDVKPAVTRGSTGRFIEIWCDHTLRTRQECLDGAESLRVAAECLEQIAMTSFRPAPDKVSAAPAKSPRPPQARKRGKKVGRVLMVPKKKKRVGRPQGSTTKRPRKPQPDPVGKDNADVIAGRNEP